MTPYWVHRAQRLWAAQNHDDWGLPPYPGHPPGRNIGRLVVTGPHAGFWPTGSIGWERLNANARARERIQNRSLPK